MSFGYGLAGFANGLNSGMETGSKLYDLVQQDQLAKVRAQGIAEAKAAQAAATPKIQDMGDQDNLTANPQQSADPNYQPDPVNTSLSAFVQGAQDRTANPDAAAQGDTVKTYAVDQPDSSSITPSSPYGGGLSSIPQSSQAQNNDPADNLDANAKTGKVPLTPGKRFMVDGQGFDTQEDAAAYVKKQTPQLESFFHDTLVPKMTATLVAQGKIDQAQAWEKYADEEQTRQNMATWGKAIKLAQFGDYDNAASELMKLYPHYDDGHELVSAEPTKGEDGESGFTMTVKNPDGSTQKIYQDAKTITQLGLSQLSPIEMFNQRYKQQTNADIMEAKAGYDQQNDERTMKRMVAVANVNQQGRQQVAQTQVQGRKEVAQTNNDAKDKRQQTSIEAKAELERQRFANQGALLSQKLAASGQFRKGDSPETMANRATLAARSSLEYQMAPTPEAKQAIVDGAVKAVMDNHTKYGQPAQPKQTVPNPMQNGITPPQAPSAPTVPDAAPAGKRAVNVYDPATNSMRVVYR